MANNRVPARAGSPWGFAQFMSGPGVTRRSVCVCFISEFRSKQVFYSLQSLISCPIKYFKESLLPLLSESGVRRCRHHEDHTINVTQMFVVNTRAVKITLINNIAVLSHGGTPARHFISPNIKYSSSPSQHHQSNWSPSLVVHICLSLK